MAGMAKRRRNPSEDIYYRIVGGVVDDKALERDGFRLRNHETHVCKYEREVLAWIPILLRDGFLHGTKATILKIDAGASADAGAPLEEEPDSWVVDRSSVPDSKILRASGDRIPGDAVWVHKVISLKGYKPAPDINPPRRRNPPQRITLPDQTPTRLALRPGEKNFALLTEWGRVYRVDGGAVRRQFTPFIGGGHHRWCKAIPEREIWIERGLGRDGAFLLIHELTEILLMHTLGFSYDKAHRYANMCEAACRVVDEQVAHHKRPGFRERAIASTVCAWMDMIYDAPFDWKARRANAIASAFVRY
jgi:hypothetical protein